MRDPAHPAAASAVGVSGLSVVLPAHDEAENLDALLAEIRRDLGDACSRLEIVVVDDGSTDGTLALLAAAASSYPELRVLSLPTRRGYGGAARVGLAAASEDLVLFTDADRQFDLADARALIAALDGHDLAIGYRFDRHDRRLRILAGRCWSRLVNLLFGFTARDVDCALKLARRVALAAVLPRLRCRGAAFSAEWLVLARRTGQRIVELPVQHRPRTAGRPTGGSPGMALRGIAELIRLRLGLARRCAGGPRSEGATE